MYRNWIIGIGLLGIAFQVGCQDRTPPPPRVVIPAQDQGVGYREGTAEKPLPSQEPNDLPPPPFNDEPLVTQRPPEQNAFVDAYRHVGRPRILIFVNRSLEGKADQGYLRSGQYDEASAKNIDYQAMENILTDWLSANGQVQIISPLIGATAIDR